MAVDRVGEARNLVRRVLRRDGGDQRRWAFLGAVWLHLGALGALALVSIAEDPVAPDAPLELVILVPAPMDPTEPPRQVALPVPAPRRGGGTAAEAGEGAEPLPEPTEVPTAPPDVVQVASANATPDIVEELRDAMGWTLDPARIAERSSTLSLLGGPMMVAGARSAWSEPDVDWQPASGIQGSRLGDYVSELERLVMARWTRMDLDPHAQALGIQGNVTVRYRVRKNGQTYDIRVVRSSGLPTLDGMAVRAIPPRVPHLPPTMGDTELNHEITLRYRNP